MIVLRVILSWLYGIGVWIRNLLFDEGLLYSTSVDISTICVGNIAVGGTGKTPHIEYLVRLLSNDYKVAVLSRGYLRKTKGFVLADKESTAMTIGDEPMQIHSKFPNLVVAVCENRVHGIHRLQKLFPDLQVILLDDAMQHRRLRPGFTILLTAADNLYVRDHLLPYGRLREHKHASIRANAVLVSKCPVQMRPIDRRIIDTELRLPSFQQLYFSSLKYGALVPVFPETPLSSEGKHPLVVSGIAHPEPMIAYLKQSYSQINSIEFPDHHNFTDKDLERILRAYQHLHADLIITTEKDAVRLLALTNFPEQLRRYVYALPIEVELGDMKESFNRQIQQYVAENVRSNKNSKHLTQRT